MQDTGIMHELFTDNIGEQTVNESKFQYKVRCLSINHIKRDHTLHNRTKMKDSRKHFSTKMWISKRLWYIQFVWEAENIQ